MRFFLVALLFATVWIRPLSAQDGKAPLQIFDAMLARMEERAAAMKKIQYRQRLITHQFEADGTLVGKAEWRSIVRPGEKDPVEYIFESKEGKVTFVEDKPEGGKPGKPGGKDRGDEAKDAKDQPGSIAAAVKKYNLRERFIWKRLADATVAGERAYVLAFEPRPGTAAKGREEKFLGQLGGTISISQADFSVLRATAALQAPYRLFWIIARITEMRLTYDVAPGRGDRLLRPIRAEAFTTVAFPFHSVRQRHWLTADQFGPRTPRGTAAR